MSTAQGFLTGLHAVHRWASGSETPVLVAVDGRSAAGKSTFARRLSRELACTLVSGDDFYRVMNEDQRFALTPKDGVARYYDWERMRAAALEPLRSGKPAVFRPYDWETGRLAHCTVLVEPRPIVIVEGLFVSRPELSDLVEYAILVESPTELRAERQAIRHDASEGWLHRWELAESWFFEQVRRPSEFNLLVLGDEGS